METNQSEQKKKDSERENQAKRERMDEEPNQIAIAAIEIQALDSHDFVEGKIYCSVHRSTRTVPHLF